jgi:hypothetical protein
MGHMKGRWALTGIQSDDFLCVVEDDKSKPFRSNVVDLFRLASMGEMWITLQTVPPAPLPVLFAPANCMQQAFPRAYLPLLIPPPSNPTQKRHLVTAAAPRPDSRRATYE